MKTFATVRQIVEELEFEIVNKGDLDIIIDAPNIYQIGYELTGFIEKDSEELRNHIHICGTKEITYLEKLDNKFREKVIEEYMSASFPVLVFSQPAKIPEDFLEVAKRFNKNILRSKFKSSVTIRELKFFLSRKLATEEIYEDYVLLEIHGVGILLTGYEDAKLGVTIELIERGHRMITDKNVVIKRQGENNLVGMNRTKREFNNDHFYIENIKGNLLDVTNYFGVKSTRKSKKINILIVLEAWDEKKFYDRLGLDEEYQEFLGEKIPKITIPVRKGRNLAIIIETAALNFRLKRMGLNTPEYFLKETQKLIKNKKEGKAMAGDNKLSVYRIKNEFELKVIFGEEKLKDTFIETSNVYRPSLSISGYTENLEESSYLGIQVFSQVEFKFLASLDEETRIKNLKKYLSYKFPVLVLASGFHAPEYFVKLVKESGHILLRAPYKKASQIIANFNDYLESYFSPTVSLHGVFVELYGFGVLLTGKSGIGKSETALELIHRGHRLISDDIVKFSINTRGDIVGKAAALPFFMEIRGLGIIDIKTLYGLGAVRIQKRLDLIIELIENEQARYMSTPTEEMYSNEVLDVPVLKKELHISSGRNAAAMVEVMVMDHMSKVLGQKLKLEGDSLSYYKNLLERKI